MEKGDQVCWIGMSIPADCMNWFAEKLSQFSYLVLSPPIQRDRCQKFLFPA